MSDRTSSSISLNVQYQVKVSYEMQYSRMYRSSANNVLMTRALLILLAIIKISKTFKFYIEAILHTLPEIVILIWYIVLGEVILVSSVSDCFFYQQSSQSIPESSTPRKDTELTQTYDQSNPEKKKTQMNK